MENTDNQEDIIEDIVESDLLSLEQGEVEESVSEDVEEIAEGGKTTSEESELKKAKANEGAHEDEEDEDEEDADPKPKKAKATEGAHEDEEEEEEEEVKEDLEIEDDAVEDYLKERRQARAAEEVTEEAAEEVTEEAAEEAAEEVTEEAAEEVTEEAAEEAAEEEEVVEDTITSEDLTRLVEDEEGLTPEFKAKAALIFEAEVRTKVEEVTEQLKAEHDAKLSEEVEAINETLTNQIDAYLTYAVEEWINENEVAIESSLRTSIAENFMTSLKALFVENYVDVPESKVDLFDELEEQTEQLKEDLAKANNIAESLADRIDELSREKILGEATKDLAETQAAKLLKLAEGVEYNEEFTKNVETLKKFYFTGEGETLTEESLETEDETVETIVEGADVEEETSEAPVDNTMAKYLETLGRLEKSST